MVVQNLMLTTHRCCMFEKEEDEVDRSELVSAIEEGSESVCNVLHS
jgi:hypothetical protein